MANFRNRPHLENRQMVQHSGAILNLSGQTFFEQGLYDTYFYNSYEDFLNGISGGTGYLNLIATSGSSIDAVSGYSNHISYIPGKLTLKPARGVVFSGNTDIISGYTAAPDVTGYIATSIDSDGTFVWTPLSAITSSSGSCIPSINIQTINPCSSGGTVTIDGNFKVEGNFTVIGTTTSATTIIETETVRVEDNNIELNYGGNHTTAIGGGITVLSGVSNSQDSRIYTLSDGTFMFEPGLSATTIPYIYDTSVSSSAIVPQLGGNVSQSDYSVILGGENNLISGSTSAGIVNGRNNKIISGIFGADYSSILGGDGNVISGHTYSAIIAGYNNFIGTDKTDNIIAGGRFNKIWGENSLILNSNTVDVGLQTEPTVMSGIILSEDSKILSHPLNPASISRWSLITNSFDSNIYAGTQSNIIGGNENNLTFSTSSSIIGGTNNVLNTLSGVTSVFNSSIIGGDTNGLYGSDNSSIIGGDGNVISASTESFIGGGKDNTLNGERSVILGGLQNTISGHLDSTILGGSGNTIDFGFVLPEYRAESIIASDDSRIVGAGRSLIGASKDSAITATTQSAILGTQNSTMTQSRYSVILGGENHVMGAVYEQEGMAIIGGNGNFLNSDNSVILGGQNITGTTSNTVYVPKLNIGTLGVGTSVNNLGIDASGNVVVGSAGGSGGVTIDPYNDVGTTTTINWDVSGTSTNYEVTLNGAGTLNLTNVRNGDYGTLIVEQDGVGSRTLAFGTVNGGAGTHKVVNGGGGSPTLTSTPNAIDLLSFTYNGTTMYWSVGNDYT